MLTFRTTSLLSLLQIVLAVNIPFFADIDVTKDIAQHIACKDADPDTFASFRYGDGPPEVVQFNQCVQIRRDGQVMTNAVYCKPATCYPFADESCMEGPSTPLPIPFPAPFDSLDVADFSELLGQSAYCSPNGMPNPLGALPGFLVQLVVAVNIPLVGDVDATKDVAQYKACKDADSDTFASIRFGDGPPEAVKFNQCVPFRRDGQAVTNAVSCKPATCYPFADEGCTVGPSAPLPIPFPAPLEIFNAADFAELSLGQSAYCSPNNIPSPLGSLTGLLEQSLSQMSYKITVRIYQTNPNAFFQVVEKTVWNYANGGTWTESNGQHVLTMGGSGTSGTLRFLSDNGENFIVALGVHNYKRWCDIVTNLKNDQTGIIINPQYYNSGPRAYQREKQLSSYDVNNAQERNFAVTFTEGDGHDLACNIIIG
ncbi:hypothetical protein CVT24_008388 [Panaeolus cyanescens]|uniref:Uncharacterized protein n=1 Tax=Panaeolus cyanescens TaxID=181874 RepID=A0A409VL31_9AGAR|nr:hypothetical protein CVT24_008388 [Panaeolus cyanescens]